MERLLRRLIKLIEWWGVLMLVLMVALVCLGVFFRYVLGASLTWYDEFASYLLVWLTFYGSVVASFRKRHIGFEVVIEKFTPGVRRFFDFIAECFVLVFQVVLLYYGWELIQKMGDDRTVSLPWVKMGWIYSVLPIAGGLMLLISAARLIDIVFARERRTEENTAWIGSSSE
jgi:TRAP-type C4-dicarboxylate transport system permease small subunit